MVLSTQTKSSVAIQIVTYNSLSTLEACLVSLTKLNVAGVALEILLLDNASQDSTPQLIHEFDHMLDHVIFEKSNLGYSVAHNKLLHLSTADYVLTLNPDVVLYPDYIVRMITFLENNLNYGSVAGCLLRVDTLDEPAPQVIDSMGLFLRRNRRQGLRNENQLLKDVVDNVDTDILGPDGAAAFYRRSALDEIAFRGEIFDEDFFMHKEDVDLCLRLQRAGYKSRYIADAKALHVRTFRPGVKNRDRVNDSIRQIAIRNRYLVMLKNDTVSKLLLDAPFILAYEIAIFVYILLREPHSLIAYKMVLDSLPNILKKRRHINRHPCII